MVELIEISLLPEEYRVNDSPALKKNVILSVIGSIAIMVAALVIFVAVNANLQSTKKDLAEVEKEIAAKKPIQDRILELEEKQKQLTAKRDGLKTINVQRDKWVKIMEIYAKNLPMNTWLVSLTESSAGAATKIDFKGSSNAFGEVGQFLAKLENDTLLTRVKLHTVKGGGAGKAFTFQMSNVIPWLQKAAPPAAPVVAKSAPKKKRRSSGH